MDDAPVPETLQTIAERITALGKSIDQRFTKVDQHFANVDQRFANVDQQFDETKAQLGVKIEAVDAKIMLVFDAVISLRELADVNTKDHKRFTERLDDHDLRILALEPPKPASL